MSSQAISMFDHKRFVLDLIDDVELTLCKYNVGDPENRPRLVERMEAIIGKHLDNMRAELLEIRNERWAEEAGGNTICNFSCGGGGR